MIKIMLLSGLVAASSLLAVGEAADDAVDAAIELGKPEETVNERILSCFEAAMPDYGLDWGGDHSVCGSMCHN